ncbi:MAG TPA: hypothetical protein VKB88_39610 [Bryobacteraceae bacterium]|nr:hypothetical protein [Bryobacteraceae bacterium]
MKKLLTLMLGLAFLATTVVVHAQDTETKQTKKKKEKKTDKSTDTTTKQQR